MSGEPTPSGQPEEGATPLRPSVVIRCFNEREHIGRLLTGICHQTIDDPEIIVVDSGSTDGTLDVVRDFPVRLVTIDSAEFSFGRSLNRGCAAATGEILVFVSAHCYPTHDDWLQQMTEPFREPEVEVVYGKQRGDERTRFSEHRVFEQWFPDASDFDQDHPFSNNANCAVRRSRWLAHPYDEELTGLEDLAWSKRVREEGKRIVYNHAAEIVHVHAETPARIYNRYRREAIAFKRIFESERFGVGDFFRLCSGAVAGDLRAAAGGGHLLRHAPDILIFRLMQYWGTYRGFAFHGKVETALKRKFYYPHPPHADAGVRRDGRGNRIPYVEGRDRSAEASPEPPAGAVTPRIRTLEEH